jgi:protein-L-isoaspartate(D-aspartate) O-methyltransferase
VSSCCRRTDCRLLKRAASATLWPALCLCLLGCRQEPVPEPGQQAQTTFEAQRMAMVQQQIRARGVADKRVLSAMARVPRHEFVPAGQRLYAYEDRPLPIGEGQTISQPYIVALMTELLELEAGDRVLEIGTGSGYQAAILAELTPHVYTIEILPKLAQRAEQTLRRLGYGQVKVKAGDGYLGWPEHAPFNAIIVTCAPERVPEPLREQLKEGGRMVIPVGPQWTSQTLYLLRRQGGDLEQKAVIPVRFVPMVH